MLYIDSDKIYMDSWANSQIEKIDQQLNQTKLRDKRFFRVDEFKRNIQRVDEFSNSCQFCKYQKPKIEDAVEQIENAIETPGRVRRRFDNTISKLSLHMQKKHNFYAPYYFTYVYSFWGILVGTLLGFLFIGVSNPTDNMLTIIITLTVGLIIGYTFGARKDGKVRRENRLM